MITKVIVKDYVAKKCSYLAALELNDNSLVELLKKYFAGHKPNQEDDDNDENVEADGPNDDFDFNETLKEYSHLKEQILSEEKLVEYNDFQLISKLSRRYYELMYGKENCRICDVDENGKAILDQKEIVRLTKKYLSDNSVKVIFEGQLEVDDLRARFDVLIRNNDNPDEISFDLIEVKGTNTVFEHPQQNKVPNRSIDKGIKDKYLYDLLFQYHVYKKVGLNLREIGYMFTNRDFKISVPSYPMSDSDLNDLFIVKTHINLKDNPMSIKDYFESGKYVVKDKKDSIENIIDNIKKISTEQILEPKKCYRCRKGPKCPFIEICFPDAEDPNSIFRLTGWGEQGGNANKIKNLMSQGIENISDIPLSTFPEITESDRRSNCYSQVAYQHGLIKEKYKIDIKRLEKILKRDYMNVQIKWLIFFDFESFQHCIPLVNDSTAWHQVVSQYSMHILRNDYDLSQHDFESGVGGNVHHYQFIGNPDEDNYMNPSNNLYLTLKSQLEEVEIDPYGSDYKVVVFNKSFEKGRMKDFIQDTTLCKDEKLRLFVKNFRENVVDLLDFILHGALYCRDFNGKGSLKVVQPTFATDNDVLEYYNKILPFDFSESLNYHSGKHHLVSNGAICLDLYKSLLIRSHLNEQGDGTSTKDLLEEALAYCKIDSWGTVIIYDIIKNIYEGKLKLDCLYM